MITTAIGAISLPGENVLQGVPSARRMETEGFEHNNDNNDNNNNDEIIIIIAMILMIIHNNDNDNKQ